MLCMAMACLVLARAGTPWLVPAVGGTVCALPSPQSPWAVLCLPALCQLVGGSGTWAVLLLRGGGRRAWVPFPELPGPLAAEKAEILSWRLGDAAVLAKRLRKVGELSPAHRRVRWGKCPGVPAPSPQTQHCPCKHPTAQAIFQGNSTRRRKEESFISKTKAHFANQNYKE